jgi:hypothetical protein
MFQRPDLRHARPHLSRSIGKHPQRLHRTRHFSARHPVVAMPSLLLHFQKTSLN